MHFNFAFIHDLPNLIREQQPVFDKTGGLHAAALICSDGKCLAVREDVGRHNAVDKLMGWALSRLSFPLSDHLLFVSGRAGFELVQKAARTGIGVFAAVGAPSSLAVALARQTNMTLLGFVREKRFNIYHGDFRMRAQDETSH